FTAEFAQRNAMLVKSMAKQITKNVDEGKFREHSELQRQAAAGFDAKERIERGGIKMPTLVVHGERDEIIPLSAAKEAGAPLTTGGPPVRSEFYAAAAHLLWGEKPRELYGTVGEWFGAN